MSTALASVVDVLAVDFGDAFDRDTLASVVDAEYERLSGAPIQAFVPVFVERRVRERIRTRVA